MNRKPLICTGHSRPVVEVSFTPLLEGDVSYLLSCSKDGNILLRNGQTGDWVGTFKGHKGAIYTARSNEPFDRIISGSADFTANVWDTQTGQVIHQFYHGHVVRGLSWGNQNGCFATAGQNGVLKLWDEKCEKPIAEWKDEPFKSVFWKDELLTLLTVEGKIK